MWQLSMMWSVAIIAKVVVGEVHRCLVGVAGGHTKEGWQ